MLEAITVILVALFGIVAVGALITAYVVWRSQRRIEDHAAEMADQEAQRGGGGGPKPVR